MGTVFGVEVPEVITCVDCGGEAHLLSSAPEIGGWQPGDIVAYRCRDCLDRWDIEVGDDELD